MGGKSRICEICGVRERRREGFFANFPIDEQRCRLWVKTVGKEDLVHLPIEKLHELRHICGDHFEKRDFNKKGNRLKKHAYPKLLLSASPLSDDDLKSFPLHVASKSEPTSRFPKRVTSETTTSCAKRQKISQAADVSLPVPKHTVESTLVPSPSDEPLPSTSKDPIFTSIMQNKNVPVPKHTVESTVVPSPSDEPLPSTSKGPLSTSIMQNIIVPVRKHTVESTMVPSPFDEPLPSTSKSPLSTSIMQNKNVPKQCPGLATHRNKTSANLRMSADHRPGWSKQKEELLKEVKELKTTIKSLRRNAKLLEKVESPMLREIVSLALKNQKRKPKGRRWTTKYKISCLSILKRSPKAYRYLQHLVPVPSVNTLHNILKKVPMTPGISTQILEHLRKISPSYNNNRYCCLLFDEMAIKPRLNYNIGSDQVEGYSDMGKSNRSDSLADHALVFMLQGLRKKFKQPLAFYFVKGTISSQKLADIIKEIIAVVNKTGFQIMATVCDQGPTNMGALKILKDCSPTEPGPRIKNYFDVENRKILIIYDVPHLFKSIRNNFLNHGEIRMDGKKAKWEHIKFAEKENRKFLYLSKLTENHVQPKYRAKMKVKFAAQTLSTTVSAVLKLLAQIFKRQELNESGELIYELDRLFDATNGPSGPSDIKRGQRQNVSHKTDHINTWTQYRKKLETLVFIKSNGMVAKNVRCIEGYLTTLSSLSDMWVAVQCLGFNYLNLRQLNQDALENFFGILRQHSPTNRNPTVSSFIAALKASIISGMTAPHSRGSNCEKDANILLTNLQNLVFGNEVSANSDKEEENNEINKENDNVQHAEEHTLLSIPDYEDDDEELNLLNVEGQPIVYISGFIVMRILKSHDCTMCKRALVAENPEDDPTFTYITLREWWSDRTTLTYPNVEVCKFVKKCVQIFERDVIPVLHNKDISQFTTTLFMTSWDASFIHCILHRSKIFQSLSSKLAILLVRRQCQRINAKLSAQEEDLADKAKKAQQQGTSK